MAIHDMGQMNGPDYRSSMGKKQNYYYLLDAKFIYNAFNSHNNSTELIEFSL